MPLHGKDRLRDALQSLDRPVGRSGRHAQPRCNAAGRHVMEGIDCQRRAEQAVKRGARLHRDRVRGLCRMAALEVADEAALRLAHVLVQGAAQDDVEALEPAADPEDGQAAPPGRCDEQPVKCVAHGQRAAELLVRLLTPEQRVDVPAT